MTRIHPGLSRLVLLLCTFVAAPAMAMETRFLPPTPEGRFEGETLTLFTDFGPQVLDTHGLVFAADFYSAGQIIWSGGGPWESHPLPIGLIGPLSTPVGLVKAEFYVDPGITWSNWPARDPSPVCRYRSRWARGRPACTWFWTSTGCTRISSTSSISPPPPGIPTCNPSLPAPRYPTSKTGSRIFSAISPGSTASGTPWSTTPMRRYPARSGCWDRRCWACGRRADRAGRPDPPPPGTTRPRRAVSPAGPAPPSSVSLPRRAGYAPRFPVPGSPRAAAPAYGR